MPKENILFVCEKHMIRSPLAEGLYRNDSRYEVMSAGTNPTEFLPGVAYDSRKVSQEQVDWAHKVFALNTNIFDYMMQNFPGAGGKLIDLHVEKDEFGPGEDGDVEKIILNKLIPYLGEPVRSQAPPVG